MMNPRVPPIPRRHNPYIWKKEQLHKMWHKHTADELIIPLCTIWSYRGVDPTSKGKQRLSKAKSKVSYKLFYHFCRNYFFYMHKIQISVKNVDRVCVCWFLLNIITKWAGKIRFSTQLSGEGINCKLPLKISTLPCSLVPRWDIYGVINES